MPQSTPHLPPQASASLTPDAASNAVLDNAPAGRRIVAIWFPYWLSEIVMPAEKRDAPFVLTEHQRGTQRLAAVNIAAEACGLHLDMALADARALVPDMHIEMLDPARGPTALDKCARWLRRYTPWVGADTHPASHGLLLDISGCAHLFGGERRMLDDMQACFNRRGITCCIAVADTIGSAWALAHYGPDSLIIAPSGHGADAVMDLPPDALRLPEGARDLCRRLGLDSIAALAAFPRASLTRRFGPYPVMRLEQALGQAGEMLNPCVPAPEFIVRKNLAQGVTQLDVIASLTQTMCATLAAKLFAAGQGAARLDLTLTRADNEMQALSVRLAAPSAEAGHLARLLATRLERVSRGVDAGCGVETLCLVASATAEVSTPQAPLTLGHRAFKTPPVAALAGLFDRLAGRLGPQIVVRPVVHASHIPEHAVGYRPVHAAPLSSEADDAGLSVGGAPSPQTRPLFMLCAPEPIEVIAEIPEGAPYRFRWRRVLHEVALAQGPERISPEWWPSARQHNSLTRDYFRVEDRNGCRFWIYRDGLYGRETGRPRWFMHGVFP